MKRILITGAGSFVGTAVKEYLEAFPNNYIVEEIDTEKDEWNSFSFSSFDTVYHVAGIVHYNVGKETDKVKAKYYSVNTDLAINVAKKAKSEGVKQFLFMSSASIYGDSAPIGKSKIIKRDTEYSPTNTYGISKVQAEEGVLKLQSSDFKIVILRCPMIYGKGGKGNFPTLEKLALKMPLFPKVDNKRSMLYIGNLAEFVRLMIDNNEQGIFWPCNREYSNTSELVRMIAECNGKKVILISGFGWVLRILSYLTSSINKAFGSFMYDEHLGDYKKEYRLYTLEQSISEIEE